MPDYQIPQLRDLSSFRQCANVSEFLKRLSQPSWLFLPGTSSEKQRLITTLLHGNEPSGTIATLRLIQEGFVPHFDTWILLGSVKTALTEPLFSHRMLKGNADLNRCFSINRKKGATLEYQLAEAIIRDIKAFAPDALVDVHNTSGRGPGFCVAPSDSQYFESLEPFANLFCETLVLTDIHLGALMEHDFGCPILTVECGGNNAEESHQLAYEGFKKFLLLKSMEELPKANRFITYRHPLRLEMKEDYYLNYASEYQPGSDLTLKHEIESLNFDTTRVNENLGWLGPEGLDGLKAIDAEGKDRIRDYFENLDGELHARHPLHLFMVTTNLEIAVSDCLFYFCTV